MITNERSGNGNEMMSTYALTVFLRFVGRHSPSKHGRSSCESQVCPRLCAESYKEEAMKKAAELNLSQSLMK